MFVNFDVISYIFYIRTGVFMIICSMSNAVSLPNINLSTTTNNLVNCFHGFIKLFNVLISFQFYLELDLGVVRTTRDFPEMMNICI